MSDVIVTRGNKKTSSAICETEYTGTFEVLVNKVPITVHTDNLLVGKFNEIIELVKDSLEGLTFRITTDKKGENVGSIYAAVQAFCRGLLSYVGTASDESEKQKLKNIISSFSRYAIVTDTRKKEPKKYGGPGGRARYQKSYR